MMWGITDNTPLDDKEIPLKCLWFEIKDVACQVVKLHNLGKQDRFSFPLCGNIVNSYIWC